jgi:ABC-type transporter Mla MlaB component
MIEQKTDEFFIKGTLDFESVPVLLKQACEMIDQSQTPKQTDIIFNFSGLSQSNSAGLALLTSLLRHANERHKNIRFLHLPDNLWAAAKVSDLDKILPCT